MRISDWSSDVCSSDLRAAAASRFHALGLSPRAGGGVAEIAGAEEGVELLRDAGEIGGPAAAAAFGTAGIDGDIGGAYCRERGCWYVWVAVVVGELQRHKQRHYIYIKIHHQERN